MNRSKQAITLAISIILSISAIAQSQKQWEKFGDKSWDEGEYYGAAKYYKLAINTDSAGINLLFRYAECLRRYNDYVKAEEAYKRVAQEDQFSEHVESRYWIATMQKYQGKYDEAIRNYKKFYNDYKSKRFYSKKAKHEIKSCSYAKRLATDSVEIIISNVGNQLNTYDSEFSPMFINDSSIYFSSMRAEKLKSNNQVEDDKYLIRIYGASRQPDSTWKETGLVTDLPVNSDAFHAANGCFSPDGGRFYFSRCDGVFNCSVYMTAREGAVWSEPVEVPDINVAGYSTTQPMVAQVGKKEVLFFTSNRPQGKGKMDIYYSVITNNGLQYSTPKNMGRKVNSIDDEITPFFDSQNNVLYFSSKWHYGLGGFDIFKIEGGLKPTKTPDNLGPGFNTRVNDFYYTVDSKGENAFLTSNRVGSFAKKGETCCNDIYMLQYPKEPEPEVPTLEKLNKYLPITLYFHNDEPGPKSWDTTVTENYMETYEKYTAMIDKYKAEYSRGLSGEEKTKAEVDIQELFSEYVDKGVSDLELFTELFIKELQKGQKIELTVKGYASPLAKTDYNVNLTFRRISSMINYLSVYDEGVYQPYLKHMAEDGGAVDFVKIPFGEYTAQIDISDNLQDQKNSVYSRKAALERKIEIVSVQQAHKDSLIAKITFQREIHDFGGVEPNAQLSHIFQLTNAGTLDLLIDSVVTACECIVVHWPKTPLRPGQAGHVDIMFDTTDMTGKLVQSVMIFSNGSTSEKALSVTAEVMPE